MVGSLRLTWAARNCCRSVGLATRSVARFYEQLGYAATGAYFKKYLDTAKS